MREVTLGARPARKGERVQDCLRFRAPSVAAPSTPPPAPHVDPLRFADRLALAHDADHLVRFEALLETAIDLDRIPDEYLIAASYDPVRTHDEEGWVV